MKIPGFPRRTLTPLKRIKIRTYLPFFDFLLKLSEAYEHRTT